MTDQTLSSRLRDTAENIHSRGPALAAAQMREAADIIDKLSARLTSERDSIVAFLESEAQRIDAHAGTVGDSEGCLWERARASAARTFAAQISTADDCAPTWVAT